MWLLMDSRVPVTVLLQEEFNDLDLESKQSVPNLRKLIEKKEVVVKPKGFKKKVKRLSPKITPLPKHKMTKKQKRLRRKA